MSRPSINSFQNIIRKITSRFDSYELFILYLNSDFSKNSPTFQAIIDFPFFYIPRSMMDSKPYFFQVEATQLVIFDDPKFIEVTYSFTGIAEALHSFGALGVTILGFISGILLIVISNWFNRARSNLKYLTIYYWTFGSLSYSLLTDKIVADLFSLPLTVMVAYFWFNVFYYQDKNSCIYPL